MKFSVDIIIFISIINSILLSSQFLEINRDNFQSYLNSNKDNENKKLLLIFYKQNCTYCEEALNIIENKVINNYNIESGIKFGKINVDIENNLWINLQFEIKRIPYIILIEGNYFYELKQKADEYSLKDFIDLEKDNSEKKIIPKEINTIRKIIIIINITINFFIQGIYSIFKISLNKNIIIFILLIIFFLFFWIIQKIIYSICSKFCCKRKKEKNTKTIIKKDDKEGNKKIISIEDVNECSSNLSEEEIENKNDENENKENNDINTDIFKKEISEESIKKKYKDKQE